MFLEGFAPEGGTTITLLSSDPDLAKVPQAVTVPAGKSSVTFPITTRAVREATAVWVEATLGERASAPVLWIDPAGGAVPTVATYQAEASARRGAVVSSAHRGYTGSGYIDFRNASGDYVEFGVNAPANGRSPSRSATPTAAAPPGGWACPSTALPSPTASPSPRPARGRRGKK